LNKLAILAIQPTKTLSSSFYFITQSSSLDDWKVWYNNWYYYWKKNL